MEELPPEIISNIFSETNPETFRILQQAGKKYYQLGKDKYTLNLKERIINDPNGNWKAKVDGRGTILAFVYMLPKNEPLDLIDGLFQYRNLSGFMTCHLDDEGYFSGKLVWDKNNNGDITVIDMVKGIADGKIIIIYGKDIQDEVSVPDFIDLAEDMSSDEENVIIMKHGIMINFRGSYGTIRDEWQTLNNNFVINFKNHIVDHIEEYWPTTRDTLRKERTENGYESCVIYKKGDVYPECTYLHTEELSSLPDEITGGRKIPIYQDNQQDLVLPLRMPPSKDANDIQNSVNLLTQRFFFYYSDFIST